MTQSIIPPGCTMTVKTSTGVGYESGTYTDPVTGQPVHVRGITMSAGVGVSTGNSVPPDIADRDREIIERELYEKGLPEAKVSIPVVLLETLTSPGLKHTMRGKGSRKTSVAGFIYSLESWAMKTPIVGAHAGIW